MRRIAEKFAGQLLGTGAKAVLLTGSWARDEALEASDVDILAVGSGPAYRLYRDSNRLVAVSHVTLAEVRTSFTSPAEASWVIPGWRTAQILLDPADIAAQLIAEAQAWTWDDVGESACNLWVAEEITGYAEEVHKLVNLAQTNHRTSATIQRYLLAVRMAPILAVHRRLLYLSENILWDLVAEEMGSAWKSAQYQALGIDDESFDQMMAAALQLYYLAAQETRHLFSERQLDVVRHAVALAGFKLD